MKKLLLSGFVVVTFAIYSYFQKPSSLANTALITPSVPTTAATPTATATPTPSQAAVAPTKNATTLTPTPSPTPKPSQSGYKDGTYTGDTTDAFYGNVQVQIAVSNGKITDVQFLQYPNDQGHSIEINSYAMPYLKQEAIAAQSANVQIVSGATATSQAFQQSLQSAINQATA